MRGVPSSLPAKHTKIGMRVQTLSDQWHKNNLHVYASSDTDWLKEMFSKKSLLNMLFTVVHLKICIDRQVILLS